MRDVKIIEFFGLPGCGKTTLCHALKKELEEQGYIVGLITDATKLCTLYRVISGFRFIYLFYYFLIILHCELIHNSLKYLLGPLRRIIIYSCVKRVKKYDYILIEHGIVQSVVSASLLKTSKMFVYGFRKMTGMFGGRYVYCKVSPIIALQRMRLRNRIDSGRLDKVSDDNMLKSLLQKQEVVFSELNNIMHKYNENSIVIDSSQEISEIVESIKKVV